MLKLNVFTTFFSGGWPQSWRVQQAVATSCSDARSRRQQHAGGGAGVGGGGGAMEAVAADAGGAAPSTAHHCAPLSSATHHR